MSSISEQKLGEEQAAFRKGLNTRDQVFNLCLNMEKAQEYNQTLYLTFIDYKKAFDSRRHQKLWNVMSQLGVSNNTRVMRSL